MPTVLVEGREHNHEDEAAYEAAYESITPIATDIPVELVPQVRDLLAKKRAG